MVSRNLKNLEKDKRVVLDVVCDLKISRSCDVKFWHNIINLPDISQINPILEPQFWLSQAPFSG